MIVVSKVTDQTQDFRGVGDFHNSGPRVSRLSVVFRAFLERAILLQRVKRFMVVVVEGIRIVHTLICDHCRLRGGKRDKMFFSLF